MKHIFILSGLFILCACENNSPELKNINWEISSFEQLNGNVLSKKEFIVESKMENYFLIFSDSSTFEGSVSTNRIYGEYTVGDNNSIQMYDILTTLVGIPTGSYSHEYYSALSKVYAYKLYFNSLTLFYSSKNRKIVFERD